MGMSAVIKKHFSADRLVVTLLYTIWLPIRSVADPGSGAFLTPGSGMRFFQIPDLGSQTHIF
jgi:hypothetical protein